MITSRWTPMRYHSEQIRLITSPARFKVVPAGRRSGKTERAKREGVKLALRAPGGWDDYRVGFGAPTYKQAKNIYWEDLKRLIPSYYVAGKPSESDLCIRLLNGAELHVVGLDKPMRIEGFPWNHFVLDEHGNMKPESWTHHLRPALSDRRGTAWLIGVPEGRNHYYRLWKRAISDTTGTWDGFTWFSSDILTEEEIEQAKEDLDELTYKQEYEGSFVSFEGLAYYAWHEKLHAKYSLSYAPEKPLVFTFDFNVEPGTASVIQEQPHPGLRSRTVTGVIGEVWIPKNSNTELVCKRLINDWSRHEGEVHVYGDATGGARGTAKLRGTDWDIVKDTLRPIFKDRLKLYVERQNPRERVRINAVNSRLKNTHGKVHLLVDPAKAPHVVEDFEGVRLVKGGSGEIDKQADTTLTHLTDGIGYYIAKRFPMRDGRAGSLEMPI